ncbi:hypothetical protein HDA31_004304 [Micromonospora carbonacea subsp. aurantiaca]|nr:hypothetical protein [Micromonospora carbonacea]
MKAEQAAELLKFGFGCRLLREYEAANEGSTTQVYLS